MYRLRMTTTRSRSVPIVICLAFGFAGCGDDSSSTTTDVATTPVDEGDGGGYDPPSVTETSAADTTEPETSATDAPDTSVDDSVEDGIFDEFVITLSEDGWLVDPEGRSIYVFNNDALGSLVSTCTGGCATTWPPVTVDHVEELGFEEGFAVEEFDFIFRDEGGIQLTYFGAPLYYYSGDTAPGDQNGEGVGGVWYLAFYGLGG